MLNRGLILVILFVLETVHTLHRSSHLQLPKRYNETEYALELANRQTLLNESMTKIKNQIIQLNNKLLEEGLTNNQQTVRIQQGLADQRDTIYNAELLLSLPFNFTPCNSTRLTDQQREELRNQTNSLNSSIQKLKKDVVTCENCTIVREINFQIQREEIYLWSILSIIDGNCSKIPKALEEQYAFGLVDLSQSEYKNNLQAKNWYYGNTTQQIYRLEVFARSIKYNLTSCPLQTPYVNYINRNCFDCPVNLKFNLGKRICENCSQGFIYDLASNICKSICLTADEIYNPKTKQCQLKNVTRVSAGQTDGLCPLDKPIWNRVYKMCVACPTLTPIYDTNSKTCIACPPGKTWSTIYLKCIPICQGTTIYNATTDACVKITVIDCKQPLPVWNQTLNLCQPCPLGTKWNNSSKKCRVVCAEDSIYNAKKDICQKVAQTNKCDDVKPIWNPDTLVCQLCPQETPVWNSTLKECFSCPAVTPVFDYATSTCEEVICEEGYKWNRVLIKCSPLVKPCEKWQVYNFTNEACIKKCIVNSTYNPSDDSCSCPEDKPIFDATLRQCVPVRPSLIDLAIFVNKTSSFINRTSNDTFKINNWGPVNVTYEINNTGESNENIKVKIIGVINDTVRQQIFINETGLANQTIKFSIPLSNLGQDETLYKMVTGPVNQTYVIKQTGAINKTLIIKEFAPYLPPTTDNETIVLTKIGDSLNTASKTILINKTGPIDQLFDLPTQDTDSSVQIRGIVDQFVQQNVTIVDKLSNQTFTQLVDTDASDDQNTTVLNLQGKVNQTFVITETGPISKVIVLNITSPYEQTLQKVSVIQVGAPTVQKSFNVGIVDNISTKVKLSQQFNQTERNITVVMDTIFNDTASQSIIVKQNGKVPQRWQKDIEFPLNDTSNITLNFQGEKNQVFIINQTGPVNKTIIVNITALQPEILIQAVTVSTPGVEDSTTGTSFGVKATDLIQKNVTLIQKLPELNRNVTIKVNTTTNGTVKQTLIIKQTGKTLQKWQKDIEFPLNDTSKLTVNLTGTKDDVFVITEAGPISKVIVVNITAGNVTQNIVVYTPDNKDNLVNTSFQVKLTDNINQSVSLLHKNQDATRNITLKISTINSQSATQTLVIEQTTPNKQTWQKDIKFALADTQNVTVNLQGVKDQVFVINQTGPVNKVIIVNITAKLVDQNISVYNPKNPNSLVDTSFKVKVSDNITKNVTLLQTVDATRNVTILIDATNNGTATETIKVQQTIGPITQNWQKEINFPLNDTKNITLNFQGVKDQVFIINQTGPINKTIIVNITEPLVDQHISLYNPQEMAGLVKTSFKTKVSDNITKDVTLLQNTQDQKRNVTIKISTVNNKTATETIIIQQLTQKNQTWQRELKFPLSNTKNVTYNLKGQKNQVFIINQTGPITKVIIVNITTEQPLTQTVSVSTPDDQNKDESSFKVKIGDNIAQNIELNQELDDTYRKIAISLATDGNKTVTETISIKQIGKDNQKWQTNISFPFNDTKDMNITFNGTKNDSFIIGHTGPINKTIRVNIISPPKQIIQNISISTGKNTTKNQSFVVNPNTNISQVVNFPTDDTTIKINSINNQSVTQTITINRTNDVDLVLQQEVKFNLNDTDNITINVNGTSDYTLIINQTGPINKVIIINVTNNNTNTTLPKVFQQTVTVTNLADDPNQVGTSFLVGQNDNISRTLNFKQKTKSFERTTDVKINFGAFDPLVNQTLTFNYLGQPNNISTAFVTFGARDTSNVTLNITGPLNETFIINQTGPVTKVIIVNSILPEQYKPPVKNETKPAAEVPKDCPDANMMINETSNKCVCKPNYHYYDVFKRCLRECPQGYYLNTLTFQCDPLIPTCPNGTFYNESTRKCDKLVISCPTGYRYNETSQLCELIPPPVINCPSDTQYNPVTKGCDKIIKSCPKGYRYNETNKLCELIPVPPPVVTCPPDTQYNKVTKQCDKIVMTCPAGYRYNESTKLCDLIQPNCPPDTRYNATTNQCDKIVMTCPPGYKYNENSNICDLIIVVPKCGEYMFVNAANQCQCLNGYIPLEGGSGCRFNCTQGFTYNPVAKSCEKIPDPTCQDGYFYNTTSKRCQERQIICPAGYFYNSNTKLCITCPPNYKFNSANNLCEAPLTNVCPEGYTYNSTSKMCELSFSSKCPNGLTYDQASNKCVATYITNPSTANLVSQNIENYKKKYNNDKASNPRLKDCVQPVPFYDEKSASCVKCPSDYPYFNLQTLKCQNCGNGKYNSVTAKCDLDNTGGQGFTYKPTLERLVMNII